MKTHAWLIKGDFDHIKAFNDVYGREIVDQLLDLAIDIVFERFSDFQHEHHLAGADISVAGDDITIFLPPCALTEKHIESLLCTVRDEVRRHFTNRFVVARVKNIDQLLQSLSWLETQRFRERLEAHDIYLALAARKKGNLAKSCHH